MNFKTYFDRYTDIKQCLEKSLRTKIDMWFIPYQFSIKIVPIYAHESSKPISLIKRRFEYLTKALLARFSKIIMFFKFLLEKVSRRFENDYIHEIEYSWSVNIVKIGSILAVYSVQLSHAITCLFSKYFQILYIFEQIFKYFALFLKNWTHAITFYNSHCKGKHTIVLKRLENYQNKTVLWMY